MCKLKKTALIIHGTGGHPKENWFPWLKCELEKLGYTVNVPQFPTPENQTPESWFKVLARYKKDFTPNTLLIGHSLGGAFVLRILEHYPEIIKAVFLVGTPIGVRPITNWGGDQPFIENSFGWELIKSHAKRFVVFHSDDDPWVGIGNGIELAGHLDAEFIRLTSAGHFNAKAGYLKFDLLLKKIIETTK